MSALSGRMTCLLRGGALSLCGMICGKHFSEGGRTYSPCHLPSVEEDWQFENWCLNLVSM